jgi:hypothetical protein
VSFDGSGDSGSIEDVAFEPAIDHQALAALTVEHVATARVLDDGTWKTITAAQQSTLNDAIEALTYDYLEETDINWYDNDGGFGTLVIDVPQGTVALDINCRYTESTSEHYSERDIATGAEL